MHFLIPMEFGQNGVRTVYRPKYVTSLTPVTWSQCRLGEWAIVWVDTTQANLNFLAAQPDVQTIPPLDSTVAVTATRNQLEAIGIPGQWVIAGMTYRTVLRVIVGMALLVQRTEGRGGRFPFFGRLDDTIGSFAVDDRQRLADAADDLGINRSSITMSTTVREALRIVGEQFAQGRAIALGDL